MYKKNSNPWSPDAKSGVNYFKHTTKHFMTPYGNANGVMSNKEILEKLYNWNCEWLSRPSFAVSELSDTIFTNTPTLVEYSGKIFQKELVDTVMTKARAVKSELHLFNKKDTSANQEPTAAELQNLLQFVQDDTLKQLYKHMFAAAGAMYSVATHLMTLDALLDNPNEFSKRHKESSEVQEFKSNPNRDIMMKYLESQIVGTSSFATAAASSSRSIWETLGSSSTQTQRSNPWGDPQQDSDYDEILSTALEEHETSQLQQSDHSKKNKKSKKSKKRKSKEQDSTVKNSKKHKSTSLPSFETDEKEFE